MPRLVLFELPDWAALEWATARYAMTRSEQARAHLDAALYEFVAQAEVLTVLIECLPRSRMD